MTILESRTEGDKLVTTEERFALVQRVARIGVFERDLRTGAGWWSPQMTELFGADSEAGRPDSLDGALANYFPDDAPVLRAALEHTVASGEPGQMDCRFRRGDELRHAEVRFEAVRKDGAVTGVRGSVQDITERIRSAMKRRAGVEHQGAAARGGRRGGDRDRS